MLLNWSSYTTIKVNMSNWVTRSETQQDPLGPSLVQFLSMVPIFHLQQGGCLLYHCIGHSLSHVWFFVTPWTAASQASLSITTSCSFLKYMCVESVMHTPISSSVIPFFSCSQSLPSSGSFPMIWLLASCDQSIRASASASVLPKNIQDWFPLRLTGLISLQSMGLPRVFFSTIVQKHQLFGTQSFLLSSSLIRTWLLDKS